VLQYAPELDNRIRPHLKFTNDSWRVDDTYVKVKGSEFQAGEIKSVEQRSRTVPREEGHWLDYPKSARGSECIRHLQKLIIVLT